MRSCHRRRRRPGVDRVTDITHTDTTPAVHYDYDGAGNLTGPTDATGTTGYGYDPQNRLTSKTLPVGGTLGYAYDPTGNLTSATQDGGGTSYSYDAVNQVHTIPDRAGNRTVFRYDANGKRTDTWTGAGTGDPPASWAMHIHITLDKAGRITRNTTTRASSDATRVHDLSYCYSAYVAGQPCPTSSATTDRDQVQWRRNELFGFVLVYSYDTAARTAWRRSRLGEPTGVPAVCRYSTPRSRHPEHAAKSWWPQQPSDNGRKRTGRALGAMRSDFDVKDPGHIGDPWGEVGAELEQWAVEQPFRVVRRPEQDHRCPPPNGHGLWGGPLRLPV